MFFARCCLLSFVVVCSVLLLFVVCCSCLLFASVCCCVLLFVCWYAYCLLV